MTQLLINDPTAGLEFFMVLVRLPCLAIRSVNYSLQNTDAVIIIPLFTGRLRKIIKIFNFLTRLYK